MPFGGQDQTLARRLLFRTKQGSDTASQRLEHHGTKLLQSSIVQPLTVLPFPRRMDVGLGPQHANDGC